MPRRLETRGARCKRCASDAALAGAHRRAVQLGGAAGAGRPSWPPVRAIFMASSSGRLAGPPTRPRARCAVTPPQELYADYSVQDNVHFSVAVPRNDIFLAPKSAASAMSSAQE